MLLSAVRRDIRPAPRMNEGQRDRTLPQYNQLITHALMVSAALAPSQGQTTFTRERPSSRISTLAQGSGQYSVNSSKIATNRARSLGLLAPLLGK